MQQIPSYMQDRFKDYIDFCKNLKIIPYKIGKADSYLMGNREIDGIQFVACNTAWFSFEDESKLWIGLNILEYLESEGQLNSDNVSSNKKLSIAIMHHGTERYFMEDETQIHGERPATLRYLWDRCHLALYGHSHETAASKPDKMGDHCWTVRAGATNAGANHPNSVNLIKLNDLEFEVKSLEYNSSNQSSLWITNKNITSHAWESIPNSTATSDKLNDSKLESDLEILRERSIEYSSNMIQIKSRQIKPIGTLPEQISLDVVVKPSTESRLSLAPEAAAIRKADVLYLPIEEAISKSRTTLLIGDLGTGKSTILAKLATFVGKSMPKCIPLIIPARSLSLSREDGVDDLLKKIFTNIHTELTPERKFNINDLVNGGYEVLLLIDGLDEIENSPAVCLTRLLLKLPQLYSKVTIVLSSRITELNGIPYEKWQICQVLSPSSEERELILKNESIARGQNAQDAISFAKQAVTTLEANPLLNSIANSPLAIRLLYTTLSNNSSVNPKRTLGDLLYELMKQRLGEWVELDQKVVLTKEFESQFPTPEMKALLLGELAYRSFCGILSKTEAEEIIKKRVNIALNIQQSLIAKQAISFFEANGIISSHEQIEFIFQPLAQISAGVYLEDIIYNTKDSQLYCDLKLWRIVSFAGTITRRRNNIEFCRDRFSAYLTQLLINNNGIAPACYISNELQDEQIAQLVISLFPNIGRRPLWYYTDEKRASVLAIASTLCLAGDSGFQWFFSDYLDPNIPPINTGSALVSDLFEKWALLIKPLLTEPQKDKLKTMAIPLNAIQPLGALNFYKNLAYLVPEEFEIEQLLFLCASTIDSDDLGPWSRLQFFNNFIGERKLTVNAILEQKTSKSGAIIWLELNQEKKPPETIICAILKAYKTSSHNNEDIMNAITECKKRIGDTNWIPLLRWFLTDSDHELAAAAALLLVEHGDKSFYLLGTALASGLINERIESKTETVLLGITRQAKDVGADWCRLLFDNSKDLFGGYTGCWRIFLDMLKSGVENGPEILAENIGHIGPFNISRYPDIRLAFQNILNTENGLPYRKALHDALNHYDPNTRRSAAMVLSVCFPFDECLAVVTSVYYVNNDYNYSEWEKYLLSMNFGPSVLEALIAALPTFSKEPKLFTLALLAHNGYQLLEQDRDDLILGLSSWQTNYLDSIDLGDYNLRSEFSYNIYIQKFNKCSLSECTAIARVLLDFHEKKLSASDKAKCYIATLNKSRGTISELYNLLFADKEFATAVRVLRKNIPAQQFPKHFNYFFNSDNELDVNWREVLWHFFVSDSLTLEEDDIGLDLLWLGQRFPSVGEAIGQASNSLLNDTRLQKERWVSRYHWLALLADEFLGLEKQKLKEILCTGSNTHSGASYSLISRLGEVPADFKTTFNSYTCPKNLRKTAETISVEKIETELLDASKESEILVSGITNLIFLTTINIDVSQDFLDKLATGGNNGNLIAGVLAYCYNLEIKLDYALSFDKFFITFIQKKSDVYFRFLKITKLSFYALLSLDLELKTRYLVLLQREFEKDEIDKNIFSFKMFELQNGLNLKQIHHFLLAFAEQGYNNDFDRRYVSQLSVWRSEVDDVAILEEILTVTSKCINYLDKLSWDLHSIGIRDSSVSLCFPLMYWSLGGKSDFISCRVFARGIKLMFENNEFMAENPSYQTNEVIKSIEPLIRCVPKHILKESLESLADFPIPEIRAWVAFFKCFMI